MKFNKIFAIALAALTLTACGDDDNDFNTAGDVTVEMKSTTLTVSKMFNGTFFNIPVIVEGDTNGPVEVTVEFSAVSENPATEGEDFVVTQKTITIGADKQIGNIEFYPIYKGDEIENSQFIATIVKAEGAKIGTEASTVITLKVPTPYDKAQGVWQFGGLDWWDAVPDPFPVTCFGPNEGETGYGSKLYFSGWMGYQWVVIEAEFELNEETLEATLTFPIGQVIATGVNFGGAGIRDVGLASVSGNSLVGSGEIVATMNAEQTEITFAPEDAFLGSLMDNGQLTTQLWFGWDNLKLTR